VELSRIAGIRAQTGKSWWQLTIAFAGGESLDLEARGDVSGFVTAFEHHQDISAT
jgi:hypothetical protein